MADNITPEQIAEIRRKLAQGISLSDALAQLGLTHAAKPTTFCGEVYGVPSIDLEQIQIPDEVIKIVPRDLAERHTSIPINRSGSTLVLAIADPSNIYAIDELSVLTGSNIEVVVASEAAIKQAIAKHYDPVTFFEPAKRSGNMRLGEHLVHEGLITPSQLQQVRLASTRNGSSLGEELTGQGILRESDITAFLSKIHGVPLIDLDQLQIHEVVLKTIPKNQAERHLCVPINRSGSTLVVAMADPSNIYAIDDLKFMTNYQIEVVVAGERAIERAIVKHYGGHAPEFDPGLRDPSNNLIPLEHVGVEVTILAGCARVDVTQRYHNLEDAPIEAIFTFGVDEGAAMCAFAAEFEDRTICGEVEEKERAFERYDDAIVEGNRAALLDQERPNLFTARLGNLPPGQSATLRLGYVLKLPTEGDLAKLIIPTTVAPRYVPPHQPQPLGEPITERLNPPEMHDAPHGFDLEVILEDDAILSFRSPTHRLETRLGQPVRIALHQEETALDRDIIIHLEQAPLEAPRAITEKQPDGSIITRAFLKGLPSKAIVDRSSTTFILDCSGSMDGDAIRAARDFVAAAIARLEDGEFVQVIRFGSRMESLWPEPRELDATTRVEASRYARASEATLGGTEIFQPIRFALTESTRAKEVEVANLIVITDGAVSNEAQVIDFASEHADHCRVFTYGVGHSVSQTLVRGLARATGGRCETFSPTESNQARVSRLLTHLKTQTQQHHIEWGGLDAEVYPPTLPIMFEDERTDLFARITGDNADQLTLATPDDSRSIPLAIDDAKRGTLLGIMWAREAISHLELEPRSEARDARIIELSQRYQIASSLTSFVLAETDAADTSTTDGEEVTEPPRTRRIPVQKVTRSSAIGIKYDDILDDFDIDFMNYSSPAPAPHHHDVAVNASNTFTSSPSTMPDPDDFGDVMAQAKDAPVIRLANAIILDAIKRYATKITFLHERQRPHEFAVYFDLPEGTVEVMRPPTKLARAILLRFKTMALMDPRAGHEATGTITLRMGRGKETYLHLLVHEESDARLSWEVVLEGD